MWFEGLYQIGHSKYNLKKPKYIIYLDLFRDIQKDKESLGEDYGYIYWFIFN